MRTSTYGDHPKLLGPDTGLARVFAFFEAEGHSDPAGAWQALTGTWNWAAPLPTALPRTDVPGPVARPAPGGCALSGQWRLPPYDPCDGTGPWLALPLAPVRDGGPDLFVVASKVLPGDVGAGSVFRLEDMYVPAGFVTHSAGEPLRCGDAPFFWTAVTALALGAARRMTDALAAPSTAAAAAELAAVLHDERLSLAATVHAAPSARQGLPRPSKNGSPRTSDRPGSLSTMWSARCTNTRSRRAGAPTGTPW
ncbi:hypothetical protein [Streptomyces sp. PSKA30]|uniref:hypothetical protein n=1 Tax=Streptomyces sp. PSKA30 TaxID=2874597 RepID=UPI001CD07538|nr:hypothetical protein [Streptomyces sp. PSKA30]MBZ9641846.1 hypothetical protein [Streptomyces sp. PSKA30]